MSLEDAFLDDINERPHDDAPRLVYADWLDDNGQPERAEFIRVQCRLAELPTGHPERPAVEKREHALWKKHAKAWRKPLPPRHRKGPFYRGFVVPVWYLSASGLPPDLTPPACAPLWEADLAGDLEGMDLAAHPLLGRVAHLRLPQVPTDWLQRLLMSPAVAHLTGLRHHWFSEAGSARARAIAESPYLTRLTDLHLWGAPLGPEGGRALAASPYLRRLRDVWLAAAQLGNEGVIALAGSPVLDTVIRLNLSTNNLTNKAADALLESPHLANVRKLELYRTRFSEGRWEALQKRFGRGLLRSLGGPRL
jgi:uncharacterized protein (TIGR02996 family)